GTDALRRAALFLEHGTLREEARAIEGDVGSQTVRVELLHEADRFRAGIEAEHGPRTGTLDPVEVGLEVGHRPERREHLVDDLAPAGLEPGPEPGDRLSPGVVVRRRRED